MGVSIDDPDSPHGNALLPLAEVKRQHIVKVLEACGFNVNAMARGNGVHRNTLHNKIAEYRIWGVGGLGCTITVRCLCIFSRQSSVRTA